MTRATGSRINTDVALSMRVRPSLSRLRVYVSIRSTLVPSRSVPFNSLICLAVKGAPLIGGGICDEPATSCGLRAGAGAGAACGAHTTAPELSKLTAINKIARFILIPLLLPGILIQKSYCADQAGVVHQNFGGHGVAFVAVARMDGESVGHIDAYDCA